jgi:hypothetical protein
MPPHCATSGGLPSRSTVTVGLRLERDRFDFTAEAALIAQQCTHADQVAVALPVPARGHREDLMQTSTRLVQQPQNDALAQWRDVDHVPNRRADQDADRLGFTRDAWLPDLPACPEVARPVRFSCIGVGLQSGNSVVAVLVGYPSTRKGSHRSSESVPAPREDQQPRDGLHDPVEPTADVAHQRVTTHEDCR